MRDKLRHEIEDILRQAGQGTSSPLRESEEPLRRSGSTLKRMLRRAFAILSPGRILLAGALLLLTALLVRGRAPFLVGLLAWTGLSLFIVAYAMFFTRTTPEVEKRWRGRVVRYSKPPGWWERFARWLHR
ncbi:MAG: hypothetical protein HYU29_04995 [Chloroflexi bacterium]|nr:hypothetical protein [Chloroflexota bacterium]